jgi:hypothetical protein
LKAIKTFSKSLVSIVSGFRAWVSTNCLRFTVRDRINEAHLAVSFLHVSNRRL